MNSTGNEAIGVNGVAYGDYYKIGVLGQASQSYASFAGYFNGDAVVTGNFYSGSDVKLKKNVRTLENGLGKIMALQPKSYEMEAGKFEDINLPQGERFGLIAQEVEAVFPELVKDARAPSRLTEEERQQGVRKAPTEFKAVDYISLIPILIQGMKEQQALIETLLTEVQTLKASK